MVYNQGKTAAEHSQPELKMCCSFQPGQLWPIEHIEFPLMEHVGINTGLFNVLGIAFHGAEGAEDTWPLWKTRPYEFSAFQGDTSLYRPPSPHPGAMSWIDSGVGWSGCTGQMSSASMSLVSGTRQHALGQERGHQVAEGSLGHVMQVMAVTSGRRL